MSDGATLNERVAVIGAGMSGAMAASVLAERGLHVRLFDKGRGPGGRMSTRREGDVCFDHGAQYFTAKDDRFAELVRAWEHEETVSRWTGRVVKLTPDGVIETTSSPRFVGVPGMNAVVKRLCDGIDVSFQARLATLDRVPHGWRPRFDPDHDEGVFGSVILALPAPQIIPLASTVAPSLAQALRDVILSPCWTLMLAFDEPLDVDFDAAFVEDQGPLGWIARNSSKPGRDSRPETWIAQAGPDWSAAHADDNRDTVKPALVAAFTDAVGRGPSPTLAKAHLWRYALVETASSSPCVVDPDSSLVACGDWRLGPRVEAACLSGLAAADAVLHGATPGGR